MTHNNRFGTRAGLECTHAKQWLWNTHGYAIAEISRSATSFGGQPPSSPHIHHRIIKVLLFVLSTNCDRPARCNRFCVSVCAQILGHLAIALARNTFPTISDDGDDLTRNSRGAFLADRTLFTDNHSSVDLLI